jgi:ATP-dependent Clp protease protease subunit
MKQWYEIRALAADRAEVWIYEEIGENFWGEGLSAKKFVNELNALDVSAIDLHINSPGGSVFDGQAIYNALRRHKAEVTTYIDGLAASIASVVALAGDRVVMPSNAMMMIHNPWGMAIGYAGDMRSMADTLDKVRETILNVYDEHSTKTRDELSAAMDAETELTAADALDYGFIDEVGGALRIAAQLDMSRFQHPPVALADIEPDTTPEAAEAPDVAAAEATVTARDMVPVPAVGRVVPFAPRK